MRWFKEWRNPKLKCDRLGHNTKIVTKRIRRRSFGYMEIVTDLDAEFTVCRRCGFTVGPNNEKYVDYATSCEMPSVFWDHIREKGYVIIRGEGRPG